MPGQIVPPLEERFIEGGGEEKKKNGDLGRIERGAEKREGEIGKMG